MANVEQFVRTLRNRLRSGATLRRLAQKATTYADAQTFAKKAGEELFATLNRMGDISQIPQDELSEILTAMLRETHSEVSRVCRRVQANINEIAGLDGLGVLEPEFSQERAGGIATAITDSAQDVAPEYIRNLIVNNSVSNVDESIRRNSSAHESMGLKVHIVRKYDHVGLHGGKEDCQWCLDREGEWTDYAEALADGAFERHPGCGCLITYEVGKTRTWQNRAGGWHNL